MKTCEHAWIITKDIVNDGESAGQAGPIRASDRNVRFLKTKKDLNKMDLGEKLERFRMFGDDDELYFEGISLNASQFQPLDEFGAGFGCTRIDYWDKAAHEWKTL